MLCWADRLLQIHLIQLYTMYVTLAIPPVTHPARIVLNYLLFRRVMSDFRVLSLYPKRNKSVALINLLRSCFAVLCGRGYCLIILNSNI